MIRQEPFGGSTLILNGSVVFQTIHVFATRERVIIKDDDEHCYLIIWSVDDEVRMAERRGYLTSY